MGKNNLEVVEALKKNNFLSEDIKQLHIKALDKSSDIRRCIKDIIELSNVVLKNLSTDKKEVCSIQGIYEDTSYYASDENDYYQKLFLNRDGFSLSSEFNKKWVNQPSEESRTGYIQNLSITRYLKVIKKILECKKEVLDKASKNKKEVLEKYFKVIEDSKFDSVFDYKDYNFILFSFVNDKELFKFEGATRAVNKIKKDPICGLMYKEDDCVSYQRDRSTISYSTYNDRSIQFTDIERVSQIYDELLEMFSAYKEKQDLQLECLSKLKSELKNNFERELVANAL